MSFDGWLDARDSATVEREWATLGARRVRIESGKQDRGVRPQGAAVLAARFLGCSPDRFAWWTRERYLDDAKWPEPTYKHVNDVTRSVLDGDFALDQPDCSEAWYIREVVEGTRGVQHITVECQWGEMTREGGNGRSTTVIRIFDRSTRCAVSIPLYSSVVWTIGDIDLTPLDLFEQRARFKLAWKTYDIDSLRGFFAQLSADLDAHFDTSTTWPGGPTCDEIIDNREYNFRVRKRTYRYSSGGYAIELDELIGPEAKDGTGWLTVDIQGLPWGHDVSGRIDSTKDPVWGVEGWIDLTLPHAQLDATLARLAAIPGIQLT